MTISGVGRIGQMAVAGNPTTGSSLKAAWFPASCSGALDLPFIVLLEQDSADKPEDGVVGGKTADDVGTAFDFAVESFQAVRGVELRPMIGGKANVSEGRSRSRP
jgi:hypothetical protein